MLLLVAGCYSLCHLNFWREMFSFFLRFCYFFIIFIRIFSSTLFVVRGFRTSFCLPVCLSVPRGMPKSGALSFVFLSIVVDGSIFFHFPPHLFCCNSFPLFPHILGHPLPPPCYVWRFHMALTSTTDGVVLGIHFAPQFGEPAKHWSPAWKGRTDGRTYGGGLHGMYVLNESQSKI